MQEQEQTPENEQGGNGGGKSEGGSTVLGLCA